MGYVYKKQRGNMVTLGGINNSGNFGETVINLDVGGLGRSYRSGPLVVLADFQTNSRPRVEYYMFDRSCYFQLREEVLSRLQNAAENPFSVFNLARTWITNSVPVAKHGHTEAPGRIRQGVSGESPP